MHFHIRARLARSVLEQQKALVEDRLRQKYHFNRYFVKDIIFCPQVLLHFSSREGGKAASVVHSARNFQDTCRLDLRLQGARSGNLARNIAARHEDLQDREWRPTGHRGLGLHSRK